MKFACITSMSKSYYDRCGKYMLDSYRRYCNIPLYLYNEDFTPDFPQNLQGWNLGDDYLSFQTRWSKKSRVQTFAKKAYSIIDAMENIDTDYLVWIDADCVIKKDLTEKFLQNLVSGDILSTHFSVWHEENNKVYHSCETGFFILNKNHTLYNQFKDAYKNIYNQDLYQDLRRFYDGEVYGKVVSMFDQKYMNNLNSGKKKYKTPISKSILKDYIEHYKGKGLKDSVFLNNPTSA